MALRRAADRPFAAAGTQSNRELALGAENILPPAIDDEHVLASWAEGHDLDLAAIAAIFDHIVTTVFSIKGCIINLLVWGFIPETSTVLNSV